MKKPKYIVHINCSPWVENGQWNIIINDNYSKEKHYDEENVEFHLLEQSWDIALDSGFIHSYYIQRDTDPEPIKHLPE